jgi:hypothetical protein
LKGRLLNLVTLLSVLVFLAVMALWASSWTDRQSDGWQWARQEPAADGLSVRLLRWSLAVDARTVALTRIDVRTMPEIANAVEPGWSRTRWTTYRNLAWGLHRFAPGSFTLRAPVWAVLAAAAAPQAAWYVRRRRRQARDRRAATGHCPACGYNLTGNASGVCPECGATVNAPASSDRN